MLKTPSRRPIPTFYPRNIAGSRRRRIVGWTGHNNKPVNWPKEQSTNTLRVGLYARVSSEQQAEAKTIASQIADLHARIKGDALDDQVFTGQRGNGLNLSAIYDIVLNCARFAGLQDVSPHVLRHTFSKHALDAGENLVTVATLMGHSRLDTTAIYTQPSQADLEKAVEKLAASEK